MCEAARKPRNHRYAASRGIPELREAAAARYARRFGVELDPDIEIVNTIGAKEGFSHLMWTLLQPGDVSLVPSPTYPIHILGPYLAGADSREVPVGGDQDFVGNMIEAWEYGWPKPRVVVLSFPHNPTTARSSGATSNAWSTGPARATSYWCTTSPTRRGRSTGWMPPSILECEGAKTCAVELYTLNKSFSMPEWRVGFLAGNAEVIGAPLRAPARRAVGWIRRVAVWRRRSGPRATVSSPSPRYKTTPPPPVSARRLPSPGGPRVLLGPESELRFPERWAPMAVVETASARGPPRRHRLFPCRA